MKIQVVSFFLFISQCPELMANKNNNHSLNNKQLVANSVDSSHYSGFDNRGNFYRGNRQTGFYFNYGTGETCFGKFQQRKCYYKNSRSN